MFFPSATVVSAMVLSFTGTSFEPPPARKAGVKVKSVSELVDKLVNEAKVL